jgi:dihydrofolate reductase
MTMSASVLYMSMSLDGFIAGPNAGMGNGLGDGGDRLHEWAFPDGFPESGAPVKPTGVNGEVYDEMLSTGAVVAGRGTFEPAGGWSGAHHEDYAKWPLVTYLDDLETAMSRAKEAAGDKNVLVHGAGIAQMALKAGLLDELVIHLVPVLLGEGRPLFEHLGGPQIELEPLRVSESPEVTHLRYRVLGAG